MNWRSILTSPFPSRSASPAGKTTTGPEPTSTDPVSITVVVATIGRPTIGRMLTSLVGQQWGPRDCVLVVGDGPQPIVAELVGQLPHPFRYVENKGRRGSWGHAPRNWVLDAQLCSTTHLMALDDDDEYTQGAIETVRAALTLNPNSPHVFRMSGHFTAPLIWRPGEPVMRSGNLGTPTIVVPNDPARLGRYDETAYDGDFRFLQGTCKRMGREPVFNSAVICRVRPWQN